MLIYYILFFLKTSIVFNLRVQNSTCKIEVHGDKQEGHDGP